MVFMNNRIILHFGSYLYGENDIVNLMQRSLARVQGVDLTAFDARLYGATPSPFIQVEGRINWLRDEVLRYLVDQHPPGVVICSAGGLSPSPAMHAYLRERNIVRVGIALSDPDDFADRSKRFSPYFNLFYTNAIGSLNAYQEIGVQAKLLPFAADPTFHRPLRVQKKTDLVVVGGSRPERVRLVEAMRASDLKVRCYGDGWPLPSPEPAGHLPGFLGKLFPKVAFRSDQKMGGRPLSTEVHGEDQVVAINSGTVYLSFARTMAGFTNVKVGVFEAAACGACILVQDFSEIHGYFEPGKEIVTYTSEADAIEKAHNLCRNSRMARQIGRAARRRVLREHSWEHRWQIVLKDVNAYQTC
jgi:glycosyltransferase involved in cell wall biosynthesis